MNPANNPPVTAASIVAAILGVITAFDIGHLTTEQTAAVAAVCALLAGFAAQHFTTPHPPRPPAAATLTDEEQWLRLERTDNGPRSNEDAAKTGKLPQDPGSVFEA